MKRSKHWADAYKWVEKVVYSCKTHDQQQVALKLIRQWTSSYPKLDFHFRRNLEQDLLNKLFN